jgi:hypothetical protein
MAAPLQELRPPNTNANSARYWNIVRLRCWWSMKMGDYYFIMHDCAKFLGTARTNSIFAILAYIGMTSISAHGSSNNCGIRAVRF